MAKVPGFAKAFAGRWRIVEMDVWDNDFLDLVEETHLTFQGKSDGEIAFGALKGFLDVRYGTRDGSACAEFSWEGHDESDPSCGRGWAMIGTAGRLVGHFYIHRVGPPVAGGYVDLNQYCLLSECIGVVPTSRKIQCALWL
jgi:hypothetical protein